MVVGKVSKWLVACLVSLPTVWIAEARAQNILHVWIDTVSVQHGVRDVFVDVKYSIKATHAHDFHAYDLHFGYDPKLMAGVDVIFDGTASAFAQGIKNVKPDIAAVVDGQVELDFTSPILFIARLAVIDSTFDTVFFPWTRLDWLPDMGFDSVIADPGWLRIIRPKADLILSYQGGTVPSDSTIAVPIRLSKSQASNGAWPRLRTCRTSIPIDATRFRYAGFVPSTGVLDSAIVFKANVLSWTSVANDSGGFIPFPASLGTVLLEAKHRTDTVCTDLNGMSLAGFNQDALVTAVSVDTAEICIDGVGSPAGVVENNSSGGLFIWPNPVTSSLSIGGILDGEAITADLYDTQGALAASTTGEAPFSWLIPASCASGRYEVEIRSDNRVDGSASSVRRSSILLIR